MAGTFTPGSPTPLIVRQLVAAGTGGGTGARRHPVITVSLPYPNSTASDGTANAGAISWINPEVGTILVTNVTVYLTATATGGTIAAAIGNDGTGSGITLCNAGTLSSLIYGLRLHGTAALWTTGVPTAGVFDVFVVGPGGTGTNNSIVAKQTEVTSTAAGRVVITYVPLT